MVVNQMFLFVGMTGFEPATTRPPDSPDIRLRNMIINNLWMFLFLWFNYEFKQKIKLRNM